MPLTLWISSLLTMQKIIPAQEKMRFAKARQIFNFFASQTIFSKLFYEQRIPAGTKLTGLVIFCHVLHNYHRACPVQAQISLIPIGE